MKPDPIENQTDLTIRDAIEKYAHAYEELEKLQKDVSNRNKLPIHADQKTGMIGEYWAKSFADASFGCECTVSFSDNPSEHGWDLKVVENLSGEVVHRIQVKTVSAWSKSRTMSPLHNPKNKPKNAQVNWNPWSDLWLIFLDKKLRPTGFWCMEASEVEFNDKSSLKQCTMREPNKETGGSTCFNWPEKNEIELFRQCIS